MDRSLIRAFRATLAYDGSGFKGAQLQLDARTVVGVVSSALSTVLDHPVRIRIASRTDSGVHATGQVMAFRTSADRTADQIRKALNSMLPDDIRVTDCRDAELGFNPRYSAIGKVYGYRILRSRELPPLSRNFVLFVPEEKPFNLNYLKSEVRELVGTHDFRSFSSRLETGENAVKTIWQVEVNENLPVVEIRFAGSGFLYQMVRRMVGLALAVSQGREKPGRVKAALANPEQGSVTYNAQPQGLVLEKVLYSDDALETALKAMIGSDTLPQGSV
jgi:tRNA pseudouridine38-40 synthase